MTENGLFQILIFLLTILILVQPLGWYIARVYEGKSCGLNNLFKPFEYWFYRICHIHLDKEMGWKKYLKTMLLFNFLSMIFVYIIQRIQFYLPFNPEHFAGVSPMLAFNTATSFITNTNWQAYAGEKSLSYFTQMCGLTVQNFISAATGMSLLVAFIRGIARNETNSLGNFWVDTFRGIFYILLPLSFLFSIFLASQGVIQNLKPYEKVELIQPFKNETSMVTQQIIPMGPVASQVAIKQLGTNGGGFFNTNSAHPFENPTPLTNIFELIAILLIPAALCYSFGTFVRDKRQGWTILIAMFVILIPMIGFSVMAEQRGNPLFSLKNIDQTPQHNLSSGGNMEGKETRFGIVNSALWATVTTATSNGSVNSMHDSFTPLGSLIPLWMMHLGEIVFGGVGSGLYGMLIMTLMTVFISGLMVGRTPEYLGKKIEPFEMKMAAFAILLMPMIVLILCGIAVLLPNNQVILGNPGPHGFTEILYALTSIGNNNGSAFAGLNSNTPFFNVVGGVEMLMVRFWTAISVLAVAGSLVRKKRLPNNLGTLSTHTPLFILLIIFVTLIFGALTFFPALAIGPIVEHFILWGQYGH